MKLIQKNLLLEIAYINLREAVLRAKKLILKPEQNAVVGSFVNHIAGSDADPYAQGGVALASRLLSIKNVGST